MDPASGSLGSESFNVRLEELNVIDMAFLAGCAQPTVALLYEDAKHARHIKTYAIGMRSKVGGGLGSVVCTACVFACVAACVFHDYTWCWVSRPQACFLSTCAQQPSAQCISTLYCWHHRQPHSPTPSPPPLIPPGSGGGPPVSPEPGCGRLHDYTCARAPGRRDRAGRGGGHLLLNQRAAVPAQRGARPDDRAGAARGAVGPG